MDPQKLGQAAVKEMWAKRIELWRSRGLSNSQAYARIGKVIGCSPAKVQYYMDARYAARQKTYASNSKLRRKGQRTNPIPLLQSEEECYPEYGTAAYYTWRTRLRTHPDRYIVELFQRRNRERMTLQEICDGLFNDLGVTRMRNSSVEHLLLVGYQNKQKKAEINGPPPYLDEIDPGLWRFSAEPYRVESDSQIMIR